MWKYKEIPISDVAQLTMPCHQTWWVDTWKPIARPISLTSSADGHGLRCAKCWDSAREIQGGYYRDPKHLKRRGVEIHSELAECNAKVFLFTPGTGRWSKEEQAKSSNTYLMPMDFDRTHVLIEHMAPHHTYCRYRGTPANWKPPHGGRFTWSTPVFTSSPKKIRLRMPGGPGFLHQHKPQAMAENIRLTQHVFLIW